MECAICYKSNTKEKVCKLDCNHLFCNSCIKKWYMKNPSCPMCRNPILNENWDTEFINTIFIEKFNELINEKKINLYTVGELQIAHFFASHDKNINYIRHWDCYNNWYNHMAAYTKIEYDKKKKKRQLSDIKYILTNINHLLILSILCSYTIFLNVCIVFLGFHL